MVNIKTTLKIIHKETGCEKMTMEELKNIIDNIDNIYPDKVTMKVIG